jgi:phosphoglycolate phosphatase
MQAIIFDLDGTLIDSAPDIRAAVNTMLQSLGEPPMPLPEVTSFIGNGLPHLVRLVMQARQIDPALHETLTKRTLAAYHTEETTLTVLYPGVRETLTALKSAGLRLGLCTNKPFAPTESILETFGLTALFDAVVGGDTLPQRKPDPAPLRHVITALKAREVLYVGDSEVDATTAQNAGVPFALFTEGYRKTPAPELGASLVFSNFAEFWPAAQRHLAAPTEATISEK